MALVAVPLNRERHCSDFPPMTLLMAYEIIKFSTEIPLLLTGILTTNIFSQEEEEQQQQLDMQFPTFSG